MTNKNINPWGLSAPLTDTEEELRRSIFGRDYREREEWRNYLLSIIAEQQADPRANARN